MGRRVVGERPAARDNVGARTTPSGGQYDLSTPEEAAESFAAAAETGDGEALLQLTCPRELAA